MKSIQQLSLVILTLFSVSCTQSTLEPQQITKRVRIEKIKEIVSEATREFPGVVKEYQTNRLSFRVAGPISKIYVRQGEFIKKGELIAEIDSRDYQLQYDATKAEYEKIIAETERVIKLYERNSVSEADYQKALAGQRMITAKLQHTQNQLNDTKLRAPYDGYIQNIYFKAGEIVNIGMPIADMLDISKPTIEVFLPAEMYLQKENFKNLVAVSEFWPKPLILSILEFQTKASGSSLLKTIFSIQSAPEDITIIPGTEVKVRITLQLPTKNNPTIPISAIFYRTDTPFVWIFNPSDSTVVSRKIEIISIDPQGRAIISNGLQAGEYIVISGAHTLEENDKTELIQPRSKTNVGGLL